MSKKRLIETDRVFTEKIIVSNNGKKVEAKTLLEAINDASVSEKAGGGRPSFWEMVFWWTRKPLAGARFVIASSLLPEDADISQVSRALGFNTKIIHRKNPDVKLLGDYKKFLEGKKLLDPYSGFGNIPLEALKLGLDATAVELLPTAYVFLKAVLEYPLKYKNKTIIITKKELESLGYKGNKNLIKLIDKDKIELPLLIYDLTKYGNQILEELRRDTEIKELYDEDTAVYIGTWEIKCPHCGRYTPLVGNYWLARVKDNKGYKRLVYMQPTDNPEEPIRIIDLNKKHSPKAIQGAKINGNKITIAGKTYTVPEPNINSRQNTARCIYCGNILKYYNPKEKTHYIDNKTKNKNELEWIVKWAIKEYNKKLEEYLTGNITLEELKQSPARPRFLAKVKIIGKELKFESCNNKDNKKLWKAVEKLKLLGDDPDIPMEPIPEYETRSIWVVVYGFNKWFKIFNPRQLITLVKLVKLIRNTGKRVKEEKLREGWSEEEAYRYAEAVTTYLAIALARYVTFNSVTATIRADTIMGAIVAGSLTFRGIAMVWNYGEITPYADITGSWIRNVRSVCNGLSYLIYPVSSSYSKVKVLLDDATLLGKLDDERFDVIVTDPPYYDDVPYTELSDFYYVWLKRALSDNDGVRLRPLFVSEAFFEDDSKERVVQWKELAQYEVSVNLGRLGSKYKMEEAIKIFEEHLGYSFSRMCELLKKDGVIATYYAHTSPEAWISLLGGGWEKASMRITQAFPLYTESAQRVTGRGKVRLDTSLVVTWRCDVDGEANIDDLKDFVMENAVGFAEKLLLHRVRGFDLVIGVYGKILEGLTRYKQLYDHFGKIDSRRLVNMYAYPMTGMALAKATGRLYRTPGLESKIAVFYLLARIIGGKEYDGSSIGLLGLLSGINYKLLESPQYRLMRRNKDVFKLLVPDKHSKQSIEQVLRERSLSLSPPKPRNTIDALHLLYYYSVSFDKKRFMEKRNELFGLYKVYVEEAENLAYLLCKILPQDEPEQKLSCHLVNQLNRPRGTLDTFI